MLKPFTRSAFNHSNSASGEHQRANPVQTITLSIAIVMMVAACSGGSDESTADQAGAATELAPEASGTLPAANDKIDMTAPPTDAKSTDLPAFDVISNGRTLYVSNSGSNSNSGLVESAPVQSIQTAVDRALPGDTVLVRQGTYSYPQNPGGDVVVMRNSGKPDAWISLKAYPGETPVIQTVNWSAIKVQSSYILVEGFSIIGNRDSVTYAAAAAQQSDLNNPAISGIGIAVGAPWNAPTQNPHHVVIRGNKIEKCPGSGIGIVRSDYLLIENNIVSGNAWWSPYGNSGISLYQNYNSDQSTGYKVVVRGNVVTDTYNKFPSFFARVISDGNGIIVDDARNTQNFSGIVGSPYKGRTLIDSNVVYRNGGRGINIFTSDHVDVVNNTLYQNSLQNETPEGEISMVSTSDINLVNNILVPLSYRPALTRWNGSDSTGAGAAHFIANNLVWGGTGFNGSEATNLIGVNPQFVDAANNDFRLAATSPAIDAALGRFSFAGAVFGAPRPLGEGPDIGAHETP
ncbi:MAG: right-handed parallel beta-helix repeat-containing protein [Burkholderiaceae bacterium]